ncbi:MAG: tetratricopeptide repeat protein [Spirochaetales bacterium]|jgi:tetratricopeptide (TPR) repeat protein|nr:tetratricopeptide repeat protein [Spirochaetales bacterium]
MDNPVIIAVLIIGVLGLVAAMIGLKRRGGGGSRGSSREKVMTLKEANKRLTSNPKDARALMVVADAAYVEQAWDKAIKAYGILQELCATDKTLDESFISQRLGLAAMQVKNYNLAYKNLLYTWSVKSDIFDVNYNLGYLEYLRKSYEKAISFLTAAKNSRGDHAATLKYLGLSLARLNRNPDAAPHLKRALELDPGDKETLYILGQIYHNLNQNDLALKTFGQLKTDPLMGPKAAVYAGSINTSLKRYDEAIADYELGLKHEAIPPDINLELKYRLAVVYLQKQKIGPALKQLREINAIATGYRDVEALIGKYAEMNSNQNLQIYLMGQTSDFVALCRRVTTVVFPKAKIKVTNISVEKNEYADILTEISTPKWEDVILFRFLRTQGVVGDMILRDLYSRIKETRAGRGFCFVGGTFSETAKQFVEARLIDLIEKDQLARTLAKLS